MSCRLCGSNPDYGDTPRRCGFSAIGHECDAPVFRADNWNCGTLNAIKTCAEFYGRICTDTDCGRIWTLPYPLAGGWIILTGSPTGGRVDSGVYLEDGRGYLLPLAVAEKAIRYYQKRTIGGDCEVLA